MSAKAYRTFSAQKLSVRQEEQLRAKPLLNILQEQLKNQGSRLTDWRKETEEAIAAYLKEQQ